jgi:hypothetical protein
MDSHHFRNNSQGSDNTVEVLIGLTVDRVGAERFAVVGGQIHPPETIW